MGKIDGRTAEESMGERLKKLREERRLSQEDVANYVQVKRQTVSNWECDKTMPGKGNLIKLGEFYGISLGELMGTEKKTEQTPQDDTPIEKAVSFVERWENDAQLRKWTLIGTLSAVVVAASMSIPPLGFVLCISTFFVSRKWKVNNVWLNLLILVCLMVNLYGIYAILNHTVFSFGYGTVTPL